MEMITTPEVQRSYLIQGLHALRIAKDCFQNVQREMKGGLGETKGKRYERQINDIYTDFISTPQFPKEVRDGVRTEWNSDVFAVSAIAEKIALIPPDKREMIETLIDSLLNGEEIFITNE